MPPSEDKAGPVPIGAVDPACQRVKAWCAELHTTVQAVLRGDVAGHLTTEPFSGDPAGACSCGLDRALADADLPGGDSGEPWRGWDRPRTSTRWGASAASPVRSLAP